MVSYTVGSITYSPDYGRQVHQKPATLSKEQLAVQYLKDILYGATITHEKVEEIKKWLEQQ